MRKTSNIGVVNTLKTRDHPSAPAAAHTDHTVKPPPTTPLPQPKLPPVLTGYLPSLAVRCLVGLSGTLSPQ